MAAPEIIKGDRISAQNHSYIVDRVLDQAYYGPRVKAGASDCWGLDVEFIDARGGYHHWKQNQDHGYAERKTGLHWLTVSDEGCLNVGDTITIRWYDGNGNGEYAKAEYRGTDPGTKCHIFRSVTYGWKYYLSKNLDTITHENAPGEKLKADNRTGWLRVIP